VVTLKAFCADHTKQIRCKARKLVGMNYRQFYALADTNTLLRIYLTCIHPHLEYVCQLWDPNTTKGVQSLESVQKLLARFVYYGIWTMKAIYNSWISHLYHNVASF